MSLGVLFLPGISIKDTSCPRPSTCICGKKTGHCCAQCIRRRLLGSCLQASWTQHIYVLQFLSVLSLAEGLEGARDWKSWNRNETCDCSSERIWLFFGPTGGPSLCDLTESHQPCTPQIHKHCIEWIYYIYIYIMWYIVISIYYIHLYYMMLFYVHVHYIHIIR